MGRSCLTTLSANAASASSADCGPLDGGACSSVGRGGRNSESCEGEDGFEMGEKEKGWCEWRAYSRVFERNNGNFVCLIHGNFLVLCIRISKNAKSLASVPTMGNVWDADARLALKPDVTGSAVRVPITSGCIRMKRQSSGCIGN